MQMFSGKSSRFLLLCCVVFKRQIERHFYVTSFGNSVDRLLRRTLVRSECYSSFFNREERRDERKGSQRLCASLRFFVIFAVNLSAQ
jgi:hypothetical protein